jgi:hypothetical protein
MGKEWPTHWAKDAPPVPAGVIEKNAGSDPDSGRSLSASANKQVFIPQTWSSYVFRAC